MSSYDYMEMLSTAQASGTARNTFTASVTLLPPAALHTIAPDDWCIGKALWVKAAGDISNVVTTSPTFTFNLLFGATTIWTSGALVTSQTAHTTVPWMLEVMLTCRVVGSSATVMAQGEAQSRAFIAASAADLTTSGHPSLMAPATTPATLGTFNSNTSQQVDLQAACQTSAAGNAIQLHQYWLGQLN